MLQYVSAAYTEDQAGQAEKTELISLHSATLDLDVYKVYIELPYSRHTKYDKPMVFSKQTERKCWESVTAVLPLSNKRTLKATQEQRKV